LGVSARRATRDGTIGFVTPAEAALRETKVWFFDIFSGSPPNDQ